MNERARVLEASGRTIYKFGFGQSPFAPPDFVIRALREHAPAKDYLPVAGIPGLREAIARYYQGQGIDCGPGDIVVGPGSKQLMFLLLLVLEVPEVLIPAPSWVSYAPQARLLGRSVRWIQTGFADGWRLTPAQLAEAAPPPGAIVVLNYPNNPTGLTYRPAELQALAAEARRLGVWILSDEIYGELHHAGAHESIARYYSEGTFVTGGLSKWCGAGGWRLGALRIPPACREIRDAILVAASETHSCVAAPMQYAAVEAYTNTAAIADYLSAARTTLRDLGAACVRILRETGAAVHDAETAFYLFPDLSVAAGARSIATSQELCERILDDTGVALLPGTAFGQPPSAMQVRLAYVEPHAKTIEGVERLAAWMGQSQP